MAWQCEQNMVRCVVVPVLCCKGPRWAVQASSKGCCHPTLPGMIKYQKAAPGCAPTKGNVRVRMGFVASASPGCPET